MNIIKYSLIQFTPDRKRNETINIGLVAFMPDSIVVNLCESIRKIRAVDGAISGNDLKNIESMLQKIFSKSVPESQEIESRFEFLKLILPDSYQLSTLGCFSAATREEANLKISLLMNELVIPPRPVITRERGARIITNLRSIFRQHDLFSDSVDDIFNHRIVEKFPISEKSSLRADFALKNGVYHITETIDLGARDASVKFKEAGLKSFVMAKAKLELGKETKCYAVYSASAADEKDKSEAIDLLSEGSDFIFNLRSQKDKVDYIQRMEEAAGIQRLH
ncbi:DUF3037 domain-containing protein [Pseudomonas aeruginosa]|jgi:hypothetical protein|uniref:DUF3037 domain-containing protein n=1 Tax=Pseudomonadaceae TaxID=135621 RepID=UPI0009A29D8B|nr:DUF3037 domain-containing protein [Pseudomonas aeruginosa]EIU3806615.1 DUF3037 domain-containing protein [Pseudomonas aeruginosa]EIU3915823.1 DUF3037 domain-containing protein [Pseudomonas aeruginosa]EIU3969369.1 DUF3037 domain-containing protein [Pseudomonas aeruginosa]MBU5713326.1 DUF3037 domain-containing protein [Pseudomonas aeruginosa]MBU5782452.1 DUF3037 domain-containing protein [Pseudomonas aeruginosa]